MLNYKQTLKYLYEALPMYQRVGQAAYKANLDNSHRLDEYFGFSHRRYPCIHVAGTNGKGSVSHMLASVLQVAGYKTGLYTSPHLLDFRERIKVDGEEVSEDYTCKFVEKHKPFFEDLKPSFFEMTVFMAFEYFSEQQVDIAVVEVGLGGRLDSTNVITPVLSVITNIGYDHQQFLGNTLPEIAGEKAGIIKKSVPVVVGETQEEIKEVFIDRAKELQAPLIFADHVFKVDYGLIGTDDLVVYKISSEQLPDLKQIKIDLKGSYQQKNIVTALKSLDILRSRGFKVAEEAIQKGFSQVVESTGLLGRWQEVDYNPLVICDTAHNKEGLTEVVNQIQNTAYKQLHLVLGFVNDKQVEEVLSLFPKEANFYFTQANIPRALPVEQLVEIAVSLGLSGLYYKNVSDAYLNARLKADKEDLIFVGGSTFVVADLLEAIK